MSYPLNYPTPQNANVQIFQAANDQNTNFSEFTWVKPQGASFVWFTLIGPGGPGDSTSSGGGSGGVTNFMCPAFLIPDSLTVSVPSGFASNSYDTEIRYQTTGTYILLKATEGSVGGGGGAMAPNNFTAMGFFQSVAGASGNSGSISASTTTFLSGGGGQANTQASNYGYSTGPASSDRAGFFQMQPIIVGAGGMGTANGGIGCGGGFSGIGGPGLVVIITW